MAIGQLRYPTPTNPIHASSIEERMKQLGRLDQYLRELFRLTRSKEPSILFGHAGSTLPCCDQSRGAVREDHPITQIGVGAMTIETVRRVLLSCTLINYGILLCGFVFMLAHDWLYQLHGRWFQLSVEQFDMLHYAGMSVYKIGVLLSDLVPYIALSINKPRI